ncbi:XRE family transcriptional regulator [Streptomyces sp. TG1A-60]|uniref:XRE family transcriptional regulator n=1 Tax=Streptomyces sp. TG1A-60 TaxID=3129111 RepID=UPI0030D0D879
MDQDNPLSLEGLASGAPPSADATFAAVFQKAVKRRGLPLEGMRDRLADQGIQVSLATLSYWQRGRSEPERADSLRAVDALETILDLPSGTLRSLLGPYRPRGRTAPQGHNLRSSHRLLGENSLAEQILGADFARLNESISTPSIWETVTIDENRRISSIAIQQVLRATRDGADRLTAVHTFDSGARAVRTTVRCGISGDARLLSDLDMSVIDIEFGKKLVKNETAVVDYTVSVDPGDGTDHHYER